MTAAFEAMSIILFLVVGMVLLIGSGSLLILVKWRPRLGIAVIGICLCAVTVIFFCWKPNYETRLPQFANDVKRVISPQELQKWAMLTLSKSDSDSQNLPSFRQIPSQAVPEAIRNLVSEGSPMEMAWISTGPSPQDRFVALIWGGGFGHWGIDFGAPSFEEREGDNFYIKWAPGIYFIE